MGRSGLKSLHAVIFIAVLLLFSGYSATGNEQEARELISGTVNQILVDLGSASTTQRKSQDFYEELVEARLVPWMDMNDVGRLVVGKEAWSSADEVRRGRFVEVFKTRLKETYAQAIGLVADVKIEYLDLPQPRHYSLVGSLVSFPGQSQKPYRVDYVLRKQKTWKIIDIKFGNISLVKLFRDNYAGIIQNEGLEALIQHLENQTVPIIQNLP